nr:9488_t:CDS:2 [Entrophospora candida]
MKRVSVELILLIALDDKGKPKGELQGLLNDEIEISGVLLQQDSNNNGNIIGIKVKAKRNQFPIIKIKN